MFNLVSFANLKSKHFLTLLVWLRLSAGFPVLMLFFTPFATSSAQYPRNETRKAVFGQLIEDTITPSQSHTYEIDLVKEQFLEVTVTSERMYVSLSISDDSSYPIRVYDGYGAPTKGVISFIAPETRRYRILLGANEWANGEKIAGEYRILLSLPTAPTSEFFARAKAQRLFIELSALHNEKKDKKEAFLKMPAIGEEAASLFGQLGMSRMQADALNLVGEAWRQLGEWTKAIEVFQRTKQLSQSLQYHAKLAEVLTFTGMCYFQTGEYARAVEVCQEALVFWERDKVLGGGSPNMFGWTEMQLGNAYVALGEKQKALATYDQGLAHYGEYREANPGEYHNGAAFISRGKGRLYLLVGEKQKALNALNEAIEHFKYVKDRYYEPLLLNDLGELYASLGEREQALALYEQALTLEGRMGSRAPEAQSLHLIGRLDLTAGKLDNAEQKFNESLGIRRSLTDRRGVAAALNSLGEIYVARGEARAALRAFDEALQIQREIGDRYGEGVALANLGTAYAQLNDTEKARDWFNQSLALRHQLDDREGEASVLYHLAQTAYGANQFDEARDHIKDALDHTELIRARVLSPELRASYLGTVSDYYELYVEVLMRLHERRPAEGHDQTGLQVSEMARARSLLDSLAEAQADIRAGVPADLLAREHELQQRLQAKTDYHLRLQTKPHTTTQLTEAEREVQSITTDYREVQDRIRAASPRYAALTQPKPLPSQAIQALLDDDTVLLEYSLGQRRSYVWAVTRTAVTSYELPGRETINAAAQRVYETLTARNHKVPDENADQKRARVARADAAFAPAAAHLSDLVLRPLAAVLNKSRVVVVAHERLQFIPFAVLPTPVTANQTRKRKAAEPLLVTHEIVNLPSASALAQLRMERAAPDVATKSIAVIADPVFSADDQRVTGAATNESSVVSANRALLRALDDFAVTTTTTSTTTGESKNAERVWHIPRLPGTRDEADQIAALLPADAQLKALNFDASRALLTGDQLRPYRLVHFATHALINTVHPELSGLVLSLVDKQGRPQDGFLPAHEIYNLRLQAETVVLSACQTGLGKEMRGEGLVGMTQSFFYAGAPRVVVSLWSQQDRATAYLMTRFYQQLLRKQAKPLRPVQALRAAQLEMRASGRWPSPYFWAGFTLQGEWR